MVQTKVLPISSSGEKRGNFRSDGCISKPAKSVVDLMILAEISPPSDGEMLRKLGDEAERPERSSERVTTCEVTESRTKKVRQSPLYSETPTIRPKRSEDSEG